MASPGRYEARVLRKIENPPGPRGEIPLAQAISTYLYDPAPDGPGQRIAIAVERHFDVLSGQDDTDG